MAEKTTEKSQEYFQKAAEAQAERFNSMLNEVEKMEKKSSEQVENSIDEVTRIWKSSLHYTLELNAHMRSMMLESTRRTMDWMKISS